MDFITSDWHFCHKNACGKDGFLPDRVGFSDIDEMNEAIIKSINDSTTKNDRIYHLGDVGIGNETKVMELINRIDATVIFVNGNHDNSKRTNKLKQAGYEVHEVGIRIKKDGVVYLLSHYPMQLGDYRKNIRNFCGHIHESEAFGANTLNVGIDSPEIKSLGLDFGQPVPIEKAMKLVEEKWEARIVALKMIELP